MRKVGSGNIWMNVGILDIGGLNTRICTRIAGCRRPSSSLVLGKKVINPRILEIEQFIYQSTGGNKIMPVINKCGSCKGLLLVVV